MVLVGYLVIIVVVVYIIKFKVKIIGNIDIKWCLKYGLISLGIVVVIVRVF